MIESQMVGGFAIILIFLIQSYSLFNLVNEGRKKKIRKDQYRIKFDTIISEIEAHPNPYLALFFNDFGKELEKVDDVQLNLAGSCLQNFQVVLRQEVSDELRRSKHYIKSLQEGVNELRNSLLLEDKHKLVKSIENFYYLLYKYNDNGNENNEEMMRFLNICLEKFNNEDFYKNFYENLSILKIQFDEDNNFWGYKNLQTIDANKIFIYDCFKNFLCQFTIDNPQTDNKDRKVVIKFKFFNTKMLDSIKYIEENNLFKSYLSLSEIYRVIIKKNK